MVEDVGAAPLGVVAADVVEDVGTDVIEDVGADVVEGVIEDVDIDTVEGSGVPMLPCRKEETINTEKQQFKYKPENTFNYNGTAPKPLPTPFLPCITVQRLLQTNQPLNLPDLCCSTKHTT